MSKDLKKHLVEENKLELPQSEVNNILFEFFVRFCIFQIISRKVLAMGINTLIATKCFQSTISKTYVIYLDFIKREFQ